MLSLPDEEIPQRIAFVSDRVFEPSWWQTVWRSGPAMGFASAVLLPPRFWCMRTRVLRRQLPRAVTVARDRAQARSEADRRSRQIAVHRGREGRGGSREAPGLPRTAKLLDGGGEALRISACQADWCARSGDHAPVQQQMGRMMVAANYSAERTEQ